MLPYASSPSAAKRGGEERGGMGCPRAWPPIPSRQYTTAGMPYKWGENTHKKLRWPFRILFEAVAKNKPNVKVFFLDYGIYIKTSLNGGTESPLCGKLVGSHVNS